MELFYSGKLQFQERVLRKRTRPKAILILSIGGQACNCSVADVRLVVFHTGLNDFKSGYIELT